MDREKRHSSVVGRIFRAIGYPLFVFCVAALSLPLVGQKKLRRIKIPRIVLPKLPKISAPKFPALVLLHLRKRNYVFAGSAFCVLFLISYFLFLIFHDLPSPKTLRSRQQKLTTHIIDRNGIELYKIYKDENRSLIALNDVPEYLINATVAIEDKEFWNHSGFSISGISRAFFNNLQLLSSSRGTTELQGGSTITQQLVKNTLLSPKRTLRRKIREVVLAAWIELTFSKQEILELYLNEVSYGGTAYGIQEAAQQYFGKDVQHLTLAEATLLAGLPAAPTTYSPLGANPERAKERQMSVLRRMVEDKYIAGDSAEKAKTEILQFSDGAVDIKAPHFVMYVRNLLVEKYGEDLVNHGGLKVTTTLDLEIQEFVQTAVTGEVEKLKRLHVANGAAMATNPANGDILAMVGSTNYFDFKHDGQVNVTVRPRQPGSSIKPINYAAALQRNFTPASVILDAPISYQTPGSKPYAPVNYDGRFHGYVPLRIALASSYNVPAVKVLSTIGVDTMIDQGEKMGITTWGDRKRFGLSLTLGGGEITMADMMEVYGTFANYGLHVPLDPILKIEDRKGQILYEKEDPVSNRALPPSVAYQISNILSDPVARAPAFGSRSVLNIPKHQVAVKTGTTNSLRDNWTFGYTTDLVVGAWVGNNDNSPMSYVASGITGASPIWANIITGLLNARNEPHVFKKPNDLIAVNVCTLTGQLGCSGCPSREEYFVPGTEPKQACRPETIEEIKQKQKTEQENRDKLLQGVSTTR